MKRIFVLFAFILTATFAQAQSQTVESPTERAHTQALGLQKQLALTEEQTAKAEEIYLARYNAVQAIKADATKSQDQKDADIIAVRKQKDLEIIALLTPEQAAKYDELKKVMEERQNAAGVQNNR